MCIRDSRRAARAGRRPCAGGCLLRASRPHLEGRRGAGRTLRSGKAARHGAGCRPRADPRAGRHDTASTRLADASGRGRPHTHDARGGRMSGDGGRYDPVRLEVYRNLFTSVAEEMGVALQRSAYSPNIKERRDFSCALFDCAGRLIAQGDHMPVHLGSMPASVSAALADLDLRKGEMALLNDPFRGGTHLPDMTLVSPLHVAGSGRPEFYLANRAHHSDVGGMSAGSMPLATEIYQEGLRPVSY